MGHSQSGELVRLGDTGKTVADKNEDIRGFSVRTMHITAFRPIGALATRTPLPALSALTHRGRT